ncbi:MAG: DUF4743 domain-containing protein [Castellaniella sp.]
MNRLTPPALEHRRRQLVPRLQQLPPSGARPLTVAGRVAGWVTPAASRHLAGVPGVRLAREAVHVGSDARRGLSLDAVLDGIARHLAARGVLPAWRDEALDVVGEGRCLGRIERAAVRPLGLLTRAVHLNAWSPDGRMWVARRAADKATDPGMWDTLVGGLVSTGETPDIALLRESNEEAGLTPASLSARGPLRLLVRMHRCVQQGYQVEEVIASDCVLPGDACPHNLDGEVSEIRLLSLEAVWALLEQGGFTLEAELSILDSLQAAAGAAQALDARMGSV